MSKLSKAQRDALPLSDFGDPKNRLFPIVDQDDVDSAAHLIGKAHNPVAVKARIKRIAKRKGLKLPKAWQKKTTESLRLGEAGRVISKSNETKIRNVIKTLQDCLDEMCQPQESVRPSAKTIAQYPLLESVLRQADSFSTRYGLVSRALQPLVQDFDGDIDYAIIDDLFDGQVVFHNCQDGDLFQVSYSIDDDQVTLGQPFEVERTYTPVVGSDEQPNQDDDDPSDLCESLVETIAIPLVEKAVRRDGTVRVKLIAPGQGSSGYYPEETLRRDGPKVFKAGMHMMIDHPTDAQEAERPEGSIRDLGAVLASDARYENDPVHGPGLYADAKPVKPFAETLDDIASHIGVSIRADGMARMGEVNGQQQPIIEQLVRGKTADFVTLAGAGGKVCTLMESARANRNQSQIIPVTTEERNTTVSDETKEAIARLQADNARLQEALALRDARDMVRDALPSELPEVTKTRLLENLTVQPTIKEGQLDRTAFAAKISETIKTEKAYLASILGTGRIQGMGSLNLEEAERPEVKVEDVEKSLKESFLALGLDEKTAVIAANGRA